jgi:hypothetical protein
MEAPMSKPLVISIPHRLGKEEAVRRLKSGLDRAISQFGSVVRVDEEVWSGNRLTLRVTALHQAASGTVDIEDDHARIEIALPWLLAQLATRIQDAIVRRGTLLLDKNKPS